MTDQERRCEANRKDIYEKLNDIKEDLISPLMQRVGKLEGKFWVLILFAGLVVGGLFANMNLHMSYIQRQLDKMEGRWEKVMNKVEMNQKNGQKVAIR